MNPLIALVIWCGLFNSVLSTIEGDWTETVAWITTALWAYMCHKAEKKK